MGSDRTARGELLFQAAVALVFLAWAILPCYLEDDADWLIIGTPVLCFGAGLFIGRWWVLALIWVPVLATIPVGDLPQSSWEETPIWTVLLIGTSLLGLPAALGGVGARRLLDRRRAQGAPSAS